MKDVKSRSRYRLGRVAAIIAIMAAFVLGMMAQRSGVYTPLQGIYADCLVKVLGDGTMIIEQRHGELLRVYGLFPAKPDLDLTRHPVRLRVGKVQEEK